MLVRLENKDTLEIVEKTCNDYSHAKTWLENFIREFSDEWNYHNTKITLTPIEK